MIRHTFDMGFCLFQSVFTRWALWPPSSDCKHRVKDYEITKKTIEKLSQNETTNCDGNEDSFWKRQKV
jgi:hypothetical protein